MVVIKFHLFWKKCRSCFFLVLKQSEELISHFVWDFGSFALQINFLAINPNWRSPICSKWHCIVFWNMFLRLLAVLDSQKLYGTCENSVKDLKVAKQMYSKSYRNLCKSYQAFHVCCRSMQEFRKHSTLYVFDYRIWWFIPLQSFLGVVVFCFFFVFQRTPPIPLIKLLSC